MLDEKNLHLAVDHCVDDRLQSQAIQILLALLRGPKDVSVSTNGDAKFVRLAKS